MTIMIMIAAALGTPDKKPRACAILSDNFDALKWNGIYISHDHLDLTSKYLKSRGDRKTSAKEKNDSPGYMLC